eukprot:2625257-Pleurochrysis_carterae.AAC.1
MSAHYAPSCPVIMSLVVLALADRNSSEMNLIVQSFDRRYGLFIISVQQFSLMPTLMVKHCQDDVEFMLPLRRTPTARNYQLAYGNKP